MVKILKSTNDYLIRQIFLPDAEKFSKFEYKTLWFSCFSFPEYFFGSPIEAEHEDLRKSVDKILEVLDHYGFMECEEADPITHCSVCRYEIDPDICYCGDEEKSSEHGYWGDVESYTHPFTPMGCQCGYGKQRRGMLYGGMWDREGNHDHRKAWTNSK